MKRKELKILGLSYSQTQMGAYICVLSEKKGNRKLPLIIKQTEAQKIALELEDIKSTRPLIHDVIKNICDSFSLDVQEVYLYVLLEGVFYSKILLTNGVEEVEIETMAGDALAIATIFKCPIYTTIDILDSAGIDINDDGSGVEFSDEDEDDFDNYIDDGRKERVVSVEDLEKMMNDAIANEEYEIAAELRDRITKLKNNG